MDTSSFDSVKRVSTPGVGAYSHFVASPRLRFGATPAATTCAIPIVRTLPKNQNRSRRIGPPRAPLPSQFLRTVGAVGMPRARRSSVTLSDWRLDCVPLKKAEPLKVLPPERGMILATGPPVSDSPRPPPTITCISCALPTSKANCVTLFCPNGPLTETPSTNTRPSVLIPPCAEKSAMLGIRAFALTPG